MLSKRHPPDRKILRGKDGVPVRVGRYISLKTEIAESQNKRWNDNKIINKSGTTNHSKQLRQEFELGPANAG